MDIVNILFDKLGSLNTLSEDNITRIEVVRSMLSMASWWDPVAFEDQLYEYSKIAHDAKDPESLRFTKPFDEFSDMLDEVDKDSLNELYTIFCSIYLDTLE